MEQKINTTKKQSLGRRKIEIKKIEDKGSRQVTFSKRRSGLFRKASELCILTGAEAAIFVLSPKGKVFTLGHPSVDAIIDRYEHNEECGESQGFDFAKLHEQLQQLRVLEAKRDHLKEIYKQKMEKNARGENGFWWKKKIDGMGLEELEKFRDALEELKNKVNMKSDEMAMARRTMRET